MLPLCMHATNGHIFFIKSQLSDWSRWSPCNLYLEGVVKDLGVYLNLFGNIVLTDDSKKAFDYLKRVISSEPCTPLP